MDLKKPKPEMLIKSFIVISVKCKKKKKKKSGKARKQQIG